MDTPQWSQERVRRGEKEEALSCPRCNSKETKFCYYNNYSLTQPRYLCKACRRYWTHGGSLRTIPIGGASRKNKRSYSSSSSKKALLPYKRPLNSITQINEVKAQDFGVSHDEVKDVSQGFGTPPVSEFLQLPTINNTSLVSSSSSAMELQGISNSSTSSNPPSTFMAFPNVHHHYPAPSSGFALSYDFLRPPLGLSLDGVDPYDSLNLEEASKGSHATSIKQERHLFPFESLKFPTPSTSTNSGGRAHEEDEEAEQTAGFWTGMLADGNGSWQ